MIYSGIVAIKECLEAGFEVTCFEKNPHYGGLWHYHDDRKTPGKFYPSVMRTTILNTSKELSAFSDYPPPGTLANFMRHDHYMSYIKSYVDHFNIESHIELEREVLKCDPKLQDDGDCKWHLEVKDLRRNSTDTYVFDKLMVAIGHHNAPHLPTIPGQEKFKGLVVHSGTVKDILTDERFVDKRVLIVGFGNSACDAANDLSMVAKQCYLSSHRGNWFLTRLAQDGSYEFHTKNNFNNLKNRNLPFSYGDKWMINRVERNVNHDLLGFTPKHMPSEHTPTINDMFPYRVFTGGVILKNSLVRLTEEGAIFQGEDDEVCKLDAVILATGYLTSLINFIDEYALGIKTDELHEYELYMNVFPINLRVPGSNETPSMKAVKSLAYIGLAQVAGSVTVVSELQSRWVTHVFAGKADLPSESVMMDNIRQKRAGRAKAVRSHGRDLLVGSWMNYMSELAAVFGVKPNLSTLFFKDFTLWKALMFGPAVPYQYRLDGPGKWDKARDTILSVPQRAYEGINEGKNHILFVERRKYLKQ